MGGRRIGILNGPNLNLLGRREPAVYGALPYADLVTRLEARARELGVALEVFQSNHEGDLVGRLQEWAGEPEVAGAVVNPGGLTHTSVALRDAILLFGRPVVEVHLSNPAGREPFRRRSLTAGACRGVISGLGAFGYLAALEYLAAETPG